MGSVPPPSEPDGRIAGFVATILMGTARRACMCVTQSAAAVLAPDRPRVDASLSDLEPPLLLLGGPDRLPAAVPAGELDVLVIERSAAVGIVGSMLRNVCKDPPRKHRFLTALFQLPLDIPRDTSGLGHVHPREFRAMYEYVVVRPSLIVRQKSPADITGSRAAPLPDSVTSVISCSTCRTSGIEQEITE